ncbi:MULTISPECIES: VCBS repeat-containing protein [unclassified Leucobacter]|uniref:VCBS repeat-containing protein n=1 Tax=unclassified Leucobacter TaxID=2621730 RepID=UPI00165DB371|nr:MULTISPECIES: VCBS repeat-containing protein [unclassified Leucobacter]MBC9937065.1 VCBS repeat-containing protein [Leucobacter sp. cx-87]
MPTPSPLRAAIAAAAIAGAITLVPLSAMAADPVSDVSVTGPDGSALGSTASQVSCDINGNGVPDLAVGTYATFDTTPGATGAYVVLDAGAATPAGAITDLPPISIIDTSRNAMGGVDVRCAGDVNGDGFDDLVVVAQGAAAFIVFGSADFGEVRLDAVGDRGRVVVGSITRGNGIGDIDGDGRDEVAVTDTSGVVTILRPADLAPESALADAPGPRVSGAGIDLVSVSRAGDMNGDERDDLAVGASSWKAPGATGFGTGAVWVITDLSADVTVGDVAIPGFRIDGPPRGYDLLGTSTVGLGDINGDGFGDLLIGGESDDPLTGSAVVVTGGPDGKNVVTNPFASTGFAVHGSGDATQRGWWLNGMAPGDHFGHAVGAVRMNGWSMLLAGAMDGAPDPLRPGSGYVTAVDSRELVAGTLTLSPTGVLDVAALADDAKANSALIPGNLTDQRLGRSFADLTADPAGSRVTFAAGAPALFSWQELPSVRIIGLEAPAVVTPEPGGDPNDGPDDGAGTDGGTDVGAGPDAGAQAGGTTSGTTQGTVTRSLARTGAESLGVLAAGAMALLAAGLLGLGAARSRHRRRSRVS